MKVLVVDDQADSRLLLHDLLTSRGYAVLQAGDGQLAWELMRRERPDMVISDVLMPLVDGFDLCKKVKQDPELSGTAFVFYTATFVTPEDERLAMDLGASCFVRKPTEPEAFLDVIESVLDRQRTGKLPVPHRPSASSADLDARHQERLIYVLQKKIQELESARRAFTTLISNLPGMVYSCRIDPDWTMEFVSGACEHLTGYPAEALVGNRDVAYGRLIHEDDRERVWQAMQAVRDAGRSFQIEYRLRRRDGTAVWVWEQGRCVDRDASGQRFEGYIADVSGQRRAEADRVRFFELSLDLLCIAGMDGYIKQLSPAWTRVLGWTEAELLARPWIELVHPDDRVRTEQAYASLMAGRDVSAFENRYRHKDGGNRWLIWNCTALPEEGLIYAAARDFTDRIENERKLRIGEERLDLALEFGELGAWDLDLIHNTAWRSLRHDQIFGYESPPAEWGQATATRHIVPEDRDAFTRSFLEACKTGQFRFEGRVIWPDQSVHWILAQGRTVYDDRAQPVRMLGTVMDMTRHVEDQRRLEQLNRTLRTLGAGNRALVQFTDETALLNEMCRVAVEEGGYRMAWVGYARRDAARSVEPVAVAGAVKGDLERLRLTWDDGERGQGPVGRALRLGGTQVVQDILGDPSMAHWQDEAKRHGYATVIALPLVGKSGAFGVLVICGSKEDEFIPDEVQLLEELAGDLAYGIAVHRAQEEKLHTEHLLQEALLQAIQTIALTVEKRDPYTAGHQNRVAQLAAAIATEMGLPRQQIDGIRLGALIHDIGKIYVPAEILNRPGRLTEHELGIIRAHPDIGYDIMKDAHFPWPIADMIHQHHERLDGSGYPRGLKGQEIILEARIMAVADVVEAISAHRPYRPALGLEAALEEIISNRGSGFEPEAVDACVRLIEEERFMFSDNLRGQSDGDQRSLED